MKNFEIELRGDLPSNLSKEQILKQISKDLGDFEYTKELVLFFRYEYDFRFKFIHEKGEFVLKKKLSNQANQAEWVTNINKKDIRNFLIQLYNLGYKEGLLSTGERYVFKNENLELCLKYNTPIGNFFEAEQIVFSQNEIETTELKLAKIISKFGLNAWNDEEYSQVKKKSLESLKMVTLLNSSADGINEEIELFIYS